MKKENSKKIYTAVKLIIAACVSAVIDLVLKPFLPNNASIGTKLKFSIGSFCITSLVVDKVLENTDRMVEDTKKVIEETKNA